MVLTARAGSSVGTSVRLKSGRSAVRPRPCPRAKPQVRPRAGPAVSCWRSGLTASLTAAASCKPFTEALKCRPLLVQRGVCVDGHRDVDGAVADYLLDNVQRCTFSEQQAHAGVAHVVEPWRGLPQDLSDDVPAAAEVVVRLDRRPQRG